MSTSDDTSKDGTLSWIRHTSIGLEFFATIVGCALVGLWVDRKWQSTPWGVLAGSFIGLGVGFYSFLRTALSILGSRKRPEHKIGPEHKIKKT